MGEPQKFDDATWAFPELDQFELEIEGINGKWSTFRANEHEVAAYALSEPILIRNMLGGLAVTVEHGAEVAGGRLLKEPTRTRVRLTPKSWLGRERQQFSERDGE